MQPTPTGSSEYHELQGMFDNDICWEDSEVFRTKWYGMSYHYAAVERQFIMWHSFGGWNALTFIIPLVVLLGVAILTMIMRDPHFIAHLLGVLGFCIIAIGFIATEIWFRFIVRLKTMQEWKIGAWWRELLCGALIANWCALEAVEFYLDDQEKVGLSPYLTAAHVLCLVVEKPRTIFVVPILFVSSILAFSVRPFSERDTTQHMIFSIICIFGAALATAILKFILELEQRRRFEVFAVLLSVTQDVKTDSRLLSEFVDSLLPPELRTRLLLGEDAIDYSPDASCVLIGIHNFSMLHDTMLPVDIGIAASRLHYYVEHYAGETMHRVGSIGDVICFVVNLLTCVDRHAFEAASFALRVMLQRQQWEANREEIGLRAVVHSGSLVGAVTCSSLIYYNLFGTAFSGARSVLDLCPRNQVLVSAAAIVNLGNTKHTSLGVDIGFVVLEEIIDPPAPLKLISSSGSSPTKAMKHKRHSINVGAEVVQRLADNEEQQRQELKALQSMRLTSNFFFSKKFEDDYHENEFLLMIHGRMYLQALRFCGVWGSIVCGGLIAFASIELRNNFTSDIIAGIVLMAFGVSFFAAVPVIPCFGLFDRSKLTHIAILVALFNTAPFFGFVALPLLRPSFVAQDVTFAAVMWITASFSVATRTVIFAFLLLAQVTCAIGCSFINGSTGGFLIFTILGYCFGSISVKEAQERRSREVYRQNELIKRAETVAQKQKVVRENLLRTMLPAPVHGLVFTERRTETITAKCYPDTAVVQLRFDNLAQTALKCDNSVLSERIESTRDAVASLLNGNGLFIVRIFGDSMLLAGPLIEQKCEKEQQLSLFGALRCLQSLATTPSFGVFSGVLVYETAVGVVTHSEYPTYKLFGPATAQANGILNASAEGSLLATDKVVRMFASYTGQLHVELSALPDDPMWAFDKGVLWRIRGLGAVSLHHLRRQVSHLCVAE